MKSYSDLQIPERLLLGPGPSMVPERVLKALSLPMIGHLDPAFLAVMTEVQELLRYVFQTENQLTIPISGTGSAGMEAALCNFLEPGDHVVIGVNGYFGERLCDMANRYGAVVHRIEKAWGDVITPEEVLRELQRNTIKIVALVHAETSTGALQPLDGMAEMVHQHGGLLLVDCVTSLGGMPVKVDEWGIDMAYSGTQKCLSCPPGLSPLTVSERARAVLRSRKSRVPNWYLDLTMVEKYWGADRTYHHTAPISMNYALHEALRLVREEGLEGRFQRHQDHAHLLWDGLQAQGLELHVPQEYRVPSLTTVKVPDGIHEAGIRRKLLDQYGIEIAGGLGELAGKVWRVGLMGYSSRREHVSLLLDAFADLIKM
jgi:alanine-glyoxylate transaminase / serine-glyoxylate transaminase / serine-pyruvate transaminase